MAKMFQASDGKYYPELNQEHNVNIFNFIKDTMTFAANITDLGIKQGESMPYLLSIKNYQAGNNIMFSYDRTERNAKGDVLYTQYKSITLSVRGVYKVKLFHK